jgi:hypothetical protein
MTQICRLLIVDDDPLVLTFLSQMATSYFKQMLVETADSAYRALDCIKTKSMTWSSVMSRCPALATRIGTMSPCTSIVLISGALDHSE